MTLTPTNASAPGSADSPAELAALLSAEQHMNELLQESVADLELAAEDREWTRTAFALDQEFSRQGLANIARNARVMSIASPLIKRAIQLRIAYVWGQGVSIQAAAGDDADQDVNAVVQAFLDDESNQASVTSSQAHEENERTLATDGNVFLACFTDPLTGRVQVRTTPFEEITDKITNPEDRDEPWFYLRTYDTTVMRPFRSAAGVVSTRTRPATVKVLHPALGYRPATRPRSIDGVAIRWDAPILHVPVNRPDGWKWGIPDVYAALPWARAYDGFLTDWAKLVKALSKFAWRLTGDRASKTQRAVEKLRAGVPSALAPQLTGRGPIGGPHVPGTGDPAGQVAAFGPGQNLEAIPKTGATIDSESGRPLAAMVAAAMGVSVVSLLADPGTTGNRATAETLDKPTVLEMGGRQKLWESVFDTLLGYVVDQAVKAPRGPLRGTAVRDRYTGSENVTLTGDVDRTVKVDFPDLNKLDPVALVTAIVAASGTDVLPPLWLAGALLRALGEEDIDDVLADITDPETGEFTDPRANLGDQLVQDFRQGDDAASRLTTTTPAGTETTATDTEDRA